METGRLIGNYRVGRLLGQGGMGAVYFAEHAALRLPFWCRWKAATSDFGEDWCPIRLVIGPN